MQLPFKNTSLQVLKHCRHKSTNKIVAGTWDKSGGKVYVFCGVTFKQLASLNTSHNMAVHALGVHNSLGLCATGSNGDKTMEIWDLENKEMLYRVRKLGES